MPKLDLKAAYIERVRRAMTCTPTETADLPRDEYIEALEELAADIEGMLEAAREEEEEEDE